MKIKNTKIYNNYPLQIIILANVLWLAFYIAGMYVMFKLSLIMGILYILYIILLERSFLKEACVYCCYYGKLCAFGKGIIVAKFFKKGNSEKFCEREFNFKDFIPQLLVALIPLVIGIVLLISRGFDVLILISIVYLLLSWFAINPILYGKIVCLHCKQGSICCPALKFFMKKNQIRK
ncbi:hypothetical protein KAI92_03405 [Candidatus Parcubacteria bacterium]|nr:hypothetical protein [Candidatus Parcubacteria bacterium]